MGEGQRLLNECMNLWEQKNLSEKEEEELDKKIKKLQKKLAEEGRQEKIDFTKLKKELKEKEAKGTSQEKIEGLERLGRNFISRISSEEQQLEMLQNDENTRFFDAPVTAQVIKKAKITNSEKIDLTERNIDKLDSKNIKKILENLEPEYKESGIKKFFDYLTEEDKIEILKKEDKGIEKGDLVKEIKQNARELKQINEEIKESEKEKVQE